MPVSAGATNCHDPSVGAGDADVLEAVRDSAARALSDADCQTVMRALLDSHGDFDRSLWATASELGWLGIGLSEELGGFGLGIDAQCVISEAIGGALACIPFAAQCAAIDAIAGSSQQSAKDLVPGAVAGEVVFAAIARSGRSSAAFPEFDDGLLSGECHAVAGATFADYLVLPCRDGRLALVALGCDGVSRCPIDSIDNSRGYADIRFENAPATIIGDAQASERLSDRLALLTAFEQTGGAQACLELARDYALERRAFGQPIGAFQAIKHTLADFYVAIQLARGACLSALESPAGRSSYAVACARLAAMRASDLCTQESIQLLGGIGATWEAAPHLYLRRARCLAIDLGKQEIWRSRLLGLARDARAAGAIMAGDTAEIAAYRAKARQFLSEHAPKYSGEVRRGLSETEDLELGRKWQALKSAHGYAAITMPKEYGGGGGTELEKVVFAQEEAHYDLPTAFFSISMGMPVPILNAYGTAEQKRDLLPKAIRGEEIWCQLFSEPAAGSDLAALRLSARREGDNWVLNGQKVWTSWAHHSDWGIIVARHDPNLPKHKGLTYFFVNMKAPGVTVRPIRMLGPNHVNEVFFDDVVVPDSQRLGEVGEGFKVAMQTLMIERYTVTHSWGYGPDPISLFGEGKGLLGEDSDPDLREAVARCLYEAEALGAINRRAFKAIADGHEPGPEGSVGKLVLMASRQRLARTAMDADGPQALKRKPECRTTERFTESWLLAPTNRIAGGTDQILRNTIAEKILGLPQDYRPDKGIPFNDIPK